MKKLNNKKGFTLAELLIVVAIIGVLTVVAVPIFTTQLEKSREETDIANMRAAKAAAVTYYIDGDATATLYFDAFKGTVGTAKPSTGYGKGTAADGKAEAYEGYNNTGTNYTNLIIQITKDATTGSLTLGWIPVS